MIQSCYSLLIICVSWCRGGSRRTATVVVCRAFCCSSLRLAVDDFRLVCVNNITVDDLIGGIPSK